MRTVTKCDLRNKIMRKAFRVTHKSADARRGGGSESVVIMEQGGGPAQVSADNLGI